MPTDYPSERLQAIACAGFVQLVCVDGSSALPSWLRSTAVVAKVDELQRMGAMIAPPKANNDAGVGGVILPTSGSTGTPKLVQRSQASFSHRVEWTHEKHPFTKQDVCIQARVQTATHCQYELLEPLLAGVPVHVIPDVQQLGLDNFWATLTRLQVTRMNTLPTLLQATLTAGVSLPPTLTIIELVSEPVPRKLCRELQRQLPSCHLWALYGTTEASMSLAVDISAELQQSKTPDASLPPLLGVPTSPDVGVWLLDEQLRPVPGGEVGGLFLSGPQLFDCYVGMKELTREKLVDAELEVAGRPRRLRVYGTGDLAVRSADGSLILKGRSDRQVKVRGNTVHLGDIDAHLLQSRDVTQAVSVLSGDRVVSFITPKSVDESALRSELSQRMPAYMMPATVVKLAEFPQLPNGKVDLQRLGAMAKLQDSSEQPADSLSRIVHAAGGAQQPPDYVMMSHLYALSMFFVIVHHVVWENRWQPAYGAASTALSRLHGFKAHRRANIYLPRGAAGPPLPADDSARRAAQTGTQRAAGRLAQSTLEAGDRRLVEPGHVRGRGSNSQRQRSAHSRWAAPAQVDHPQPRRLPHRFLATLAPRAAAEAAGRRHRRCDASRHCNLHHGARSLYKSRSHRQVSPDHTVPLQTRLGWLVRPGQLLRLRRNMLISLDNHRCSRCKSRATPLIARGHSRRTGTLLWRSQRTEISQFDRRRSSVVGASPQTRSITVCCRCSCPGRAARCRTVPSESALGTSRSVG